MSRRGRRGLRSRWVVAGALAGVLLAAGCTGIAEPPSAAERGPAPAPTTTLPPGAFSGDQLVGELRGGGLVLVLRHAASRGHDRDRRDLANCATQARLSPTGRVQARAIGAAFRELAIPVGLVLSSPFCRARDTAFVAFGKVQASSDLIASEGLGPTARRRLQLRLRALSATPPLPGTDTVLVTHGDNIGLALGVTVAEGEALVYRPRVGARPELLGRVQAASWAALVKRAGIAPLVHAAPLRTYRLPAGTRPTGLAPARDGGVWWTAQGSGQLGRLDPATGRSRLVDLGPGASPRDVVLAPDGAPWVTDAGRNALVRVDPASERVQRFPLPDGRPAAGLGGASFDRAGVLWFTGQRGVVGRLDPRDRSIEVFDASPGADGITAVPGGELFYASEAGNHLARVDAETGGVELLGPPTPAQGACSVWPDARGRIWLSETHAGQVGVYDPASGGWREWRLPGTSPQPASIWVDRAGKVWLSDPGTSALVHFDPVNERFGSVELPDGGGVSQIRGRDGELWAAVPDADELILLHD